MSLAVLEPESENRTKSTSWRWTTLGETGRYINGVAFKPTDWVGEGFPIIRIQNLTDPAKPLNRTTRKVDDVYKVEPGDLLVSWSATLDAFIWDREPGLLNQHIFKVIPDESVVTKRFLFYLLRLAISDMIKSEHLHGSTMKHINRGPFLAHRVPIPTLEEQQQIVAEIEKQFTRLEAGVASLKRVQIALKRYRASVLKAACEGRLVPTEAELTRKENRSHETGEQLLQRILNERREKWNGKGKYKEPSLPNIVDLPRLPEGWTWASAEQITSAITDGEHITPERSDSGVLLLSARNILDGRLSLADVDFVPQREYDRIAKRLVVEPGDVLLSCSGSVGRSAVAPEDFTFTLVRSVAVLKPVVRMGEYLSIALRSPILQGEISAKKTQTAQANIFQGKIKTLPIPLPPLAEQARIVQEVERRLSLINELESTATVNGERCARLRQSILTQSFGHQTL